MLGAAFNTPAPTYGYIRHTARSWLRPAPLSSCSSTHPPYSSATWAGLPCASPTCSHTPSTRTPQAHRGTAGPSVAPGTHPEPVSQGQQSPSQLPAVGDELELECTRLGTGGVGVCLWGSSGWVVLVQRALPGELLQCRVTAVQKGYGEAVKLATLRPHEDAVVAPCPHYGPCGGCTLQDLAYPRQLQLKADQVAQWFVRTAKLTAGVVAATQLPPVAAPAQYAFRNKMQFTFTNKVFVPGTTPDAGSISTAPALGFLCPGRFDTVLPIQQCLLQGDTANSVLAVVQQACLEQQLLPHDAATGTGCMRHLIIRSSSTTTTSGNSNSLDSSSTISTCDSSSSGSTGGATTATPSSSSHTTTSSSSSSSSSGSPGQKASAEQLMVVVVTTPDCNSRQLIPVADAVHAAVPEVVSVVHSMTSDEDSSSSSRGSSDKRKPGKSRSHRQQNSRSKSSTGSSGKRALSVSSSMVLWGQPVLTQRLCGLAYEVSAHSFFQTNTAGAELLYGCVAAACDLQPTDVLLDLYCGTGTIGLSLAHRAQQVIGFDVSASAIADAKKNAARNGISNASFLCGDLDQLAPPELLSAAGASCYNSSSRGQQWKAKQSPGAATTAPSAAKPHTPPATAASGTPVNVAVQPDVVVVDPARAGLGPPVVQYLLGCSARRVVYVSCNAATQARDLLRLCAPPAPELGAGTAPWRLVSWQAVDMFPHTDHIETVAVLERAALASCSP